jgi:hypothetical protein
VGAGSHGVTTRCLSGPSGPRRRGV